MDYDFTKWVLLLVTFISVGVRRCMFRKKTLSLISNHPKTQTGLSFVGTNFVFAVVHLERPTFTLFV